MSTFVYVLYRIPEKEESHHKTVINKRSEIHYTILSFSSWFTHSIIKKYPQLQTLISETNHHNLELLKGHYFICGFFVCVRMVTPVQISHHLQLYKKPFINQWTGSYLRLVKTQISWICHSFISWKVHRISLIILIVEAMGIKKKDMGPFLYLEKPRQHRW